MLVIFPRLLSLLMEVFGARTGLAAVKGMVLFVEGSFMIPLTSIDLLNRADWDQFHFLEDGLLHKIALSGGDFYLTIGGDFLELLDF